MADLTKPTTKAELAELTPSEAAERKRLLGMLCNYCNLGLGNFKDNSEALRKAATYLENFYART